MSGQDEELQRLREGVNCAALLERLPPPWRLDKAESTRDCLKYRRGQGEIIIVNHGGHGWWDAGSTAKGDVFGLVQHLRPDLNFGHARKLLREMVGLQPSFPEYERVIPRDNDKVLSVGKKDFADAVDRVAAISSERSRPVKMTLDRDLLVLSAASPEAGNASEELDEGRVSYASGPLEIGFQARYLRDITDQISEKVEFHFSDGSAPTVVRDAGDGSALYVLMPMRV